MVKYDIERLLGDMELIMKTYLNTKIGDINTEKNDAIVLKTVDSEGYFLQSLDGPVVNLNPYVLYGVEDIETTGIGPTSASMVLISAVLVINDYGEDVNISKRMFRYGRALQETFEDHFSENEGGIKIEIQSLVPISFEAMNSSYRHRCVGVRIKAHLC